MDWKQISLTGLVTVVLGGTGGTAPAQVVVGSANGQPARVGGGIEADRSPIGRADPAGSGARVLYEGPGEGDGWIMTEGDAAPFAFRRGAMVGQNNGTASLRLDFPERYQVEFEALSRTGLAVLEVALHIHRHHEHPVDGVWMELRPGLVRVARRNRGQVRYLGGILRVPVMTGPQPQEIRIMVDRPEGQMSLAVDGRMVRTWTVGTEALDPRRPHLTLRILNPAGFELSNLRISDWDGQAPETGTDATDPGSAHHRIVNEGEMPGTPRGIIRRRLPNPSEGEPRPWI